jgi:hypothetical protein
VTSRWQRTFAFGLPLDLHAPHQSTNALEPEKTLICCLTKDSRFQSLSRCFFFAAARVVYCPQNQRSDACIVGVKAMIEELAMQSSTTSTASSQQLSGLPLDGSVVKLRGLPFRASVEDVLKFFTSFPELSSGNIYFKRHPDGRPSGEVGA